jgi:hypothetical protein
MAGGYSVDGQLAARCLDKSRQLDVRPTARLDEGAVQTAKGGREQGGSGGRRRPSLDYFGYNHGDTPLMLRG